MITDQRPSRRAWIAAAAQAVGLGLWLSRMAAEASLSGWRMTWLVPLATLSLALGAGIVLLLRQHVRPSWPPFLLWAYVLFPWAMPVAGWLAGAVCALLLGLLRGGHPKAAGWAPLAVGVASLGLYVATLSPDMLPADAGEFQFIGHVLGIAHPPGYALYTLLNKLVTLLPMGTVAYRANLFGALCGAGTLALLAWGIQRRARSASAALAAALFLGLSPTFWVQSTTANVRTLTTLLAALTIALLWRWAEDRSPRTLAWAAAALGLGVGHHPSLAILAPPAVAFVLITQPAILRQPRRWVAPIGACLATLAVWLYLPLRSAMHPAFDSDPIDSWRGFWSHVLATGFGGDMFYFRSAQQVAARLAVWWNILRLQFGVALPVLALAAGLLLWKRERASLALLGGLWALNTVLAVTYRAPQTVEYLLPSYLALAGLLGLGLGRLRARVKWPALGAVVATALVLLAAANGARSLPSMQTLHKDRSTRAWAEELLQAAPEGALLLANWHQATALWYLQLVEGARPDVQVTYVYPEGSTPNETVWLRRIDAAVAERPVLVTNQYYGFAYRDYVWEPFHHAWLVRTTAAQEPPSEMMAERVVLGEQIEMLGYTLERDHLAPGDSVTLAVCWRPLVELSHDYTAFAQLLGPQGVVGQGDIGQSTSRYAAGELRVDAYSFPLLLQTLPGPYALITGFYRTTEDAWERLVTAEGTDHVALAEMTVTPGQEPLATLHPQRQVYDGGWCVEGYDLDRSVAGQTRLYLHVRRLAATVAWAPWADGRDEPLTVRAAGDSVVLAETSLAALAPGQACTVVLDLPGDASTVTVQLLRAGGEALPRLGAWHRQQFTDWSIRLPAGPATYVPMGGGVVFLGADHAAQSWGAGSRQVVEAHWLAWAPLTRDYAVSVGVVAAGGSWEAKADGTPALGAIPTLKWLRGWRVRDAHTLAVPAEAAGQAALTVSVYDAFTLEPLQVLDERLVRQGQGITLRLAEVTIEQSSGK